MDLGRRLENVSVVGAAGKMGSGISLLLAEEMVKRKLAPEGRDRAFRLNLIDTSFPALSGLGEYLRTQARKIAEKSIVELRGLYRDRADLVENGEIVEAFVAEVGHLALATTDLAAASHSKLVFEAIVEDLDVKTRVFTKLREHCGEDAFFLTNTSAIPIALVDERAGLDGRIVGFHFYNPPPVQKLVEAIAAPGTRPELVDLAAELGKVLRKKLIPSHDQAGFNGNGHFLRDGLYALGEVERLRQGGKSFAEAVYLVNRVSQDYLVRPMGIFQLLDYVGIDVFKLIARVMREHLPAPELSSPVIDEMVERRVLGGQFASGAQKDGFLRYAHGKPGAVYDLDRGDYVDMDPAWCGPLDLELGPLPAGWQPWKKAMAAKDREAALGAYFQALWALDEPGARMARAYAMRSAEIARNLVRDGIARNVEDVNGVLVNGFYHAYGPVSGVIPGSQGDAPEKELLA